MEEKRGHSYLTRTHEEAKEIVKGVSSTEELWDLKRTLDLERDTLQEFIQVYDPEPSLRESLQEAVRQHLFWLIDLEGQRQKLKESDEGDYTRMLVGMSAGETP